MQLTEKIKIHPTEEQVDVLWTISNLCRLTYNFALTERQEAWKNENRRVCYMDTQNKLPEMPCGQVIGPLPIIFDKQA